MVKNTPVNAGDASLTPGSGITPEKENGKPVQYSCLGKLMDKGAWQTIVHGITKELDLT